MYESLKEKILIQNELEKKIYEDLKKDGKPADLLDAYYHGLKSAYTVILGMLESEEK